MWKVAKTNIKKCHDSNSGKRQEQGKAEPLSVGQKVLLRNHTVMGRKKIQPKFASEVWEIVEVFDKVSRVYRVKPVNETGPCKVLHHSNLCPWDGREGSVETEREKAESEEEWNMPDMEEVLKRFGVKGIPVEDEMDSVIEQEEPASDLQGEGTQLHCEESDESMRSVQDGVVQTPQPRRSKKIAERRGAGGPGCIACGDCAHEGMHKVRGVELTRQLLAGKRVFVCLLW